MLNSTLDWHPEQSNFDYVVNPASSRRLQFASEAAETGNENTMAHNRESYGINTGDQVMQSINGDFQN